MLKEIVIVDMLGEEVLRKTGALKSNEITGLPVAGIYVVKAITESGNVYHGRLIVAGIYVVKAITESGNVYHGRLIVK